MYDNAKEMAEDLALETQRANEWEAKYTELLTKYVQLLGEYGKIVHCKDCIWWGEKQENYCAAIDDPYMLETDAEDFCSWGKKR